MAAGPDTEIKITLPYWLMWCLIGSIMFQGITNILLYRQRYDNDMAFLAKVKEIQKENAELRAALGK